MKRFNIVECKTDKAYWRDLGLAQKEREDQWPNTFIGNLNIQVIVVTNCLNVSVPSSLNMFLFVCNRLKYLNVELDFCWQLRKLN